MLNKGSNNYSRIQQCQRDFKTREEVPFSPQTTVSPPYLDDEARLQNPTERIWNFLQFMTENSRVFQ